MPTAVILGAGTVGLAVLKNCLEEGIDAVCFERASDVGGLWNRPQDDDLTTAFENTRTNWSKHKMCFTDFVHEDHVGLHPTWSDMRSLLHRYADAHNLRPKIKLNTKVKLIHLLEKEKDDDEGRYEVTFEEKGVEGEQKVVVNRVAVCTGLQGTPYLPTIPGVDKFAGDVRHSQSFKSAKDYKDRDVVVVGSRSSAADILALLAKEGAGKVYMSHRGGVAVMPRIWRGKPFDYLLTRRTRLIASQIDQYRLYTSFDLITPLAKLIMKTSFNIRPEWGFHPLPDITASIPTISDDLIPLLESGQVVSVAAIEEVTGPSSLLLKDGTTLTSIDALVLATGFHHTPPTLFSPSTLAKLNPPKDWVVARGENEMPLWQHLVAPALPSLALMYTGFAGEGAPVVSDIKAMWLSRLWAGRIPLPPPSERWAAAEKDAQWFDGLKKHCKPEPGTFPFVPCMQGWARDIGCELDEHLSFTSPSAWWWSLKNPGLTHLLLDGVETPQIYRLWGTKAWGPAEGIIRKVGSEKLP